jgi:thioredoxin-like negative regulator of GroEL
LVAFHEAVLAEPTVAAFADTHAVDGFSSEVAADLVLHLELLDEVVDSDRELTGAHVAMVFPQPVDLALQALREVRLLADAALRPCSPLNLFARFLLAH